MQRKPAGSRRRPHSRNIAARPIVCAPFRPRTTPLCYDIWVYANAIRAARDIGKIKLCLREKALLQANERGKRPFCVPNRNENILLPDPGIYPLASSKKYFRDPAGHAAGLPISGIFATDSQVSSRRERPSAPFALRRRGLKRTPADPPQGSSTTLSAGNHPSCFPAPTQRKRLERTGLADVSEDQRGFAGIPFFERSWNFPTVTPQPRQKMAATAS